MARIQYRPSARSRGFSPQQLSTAGIDRMREESNRIISNMEERRRAEKDQRDQNLQAMREDAAYTERRERENQDILMGNLKREADSKLRAGQIAQQQAQIDAEAFDSVINSLVGFSGTIAKVAQERTAQMIKDQTTIGLTTDIQNIDPEDVENYIRGTQAMASGAIQYDTEVTINGVLNNEDPADTAKGYVANHGFKGYAAKANDNRVAVQTYNITLDKRRQDPETVYTASNGRTFTGLEANGDRYLMAELQAITRKDVSSYMGFTDPLYLSEAIKQIDESDAVIRGQASKESLKRSQEVIRQQALDISSMGTVEAVTLAYTRIKASEGAAAAHDWYQENVIANPNIPEDVAAAPVLTQSGKPYSEEWRDSRWNPGMKLRRERELENDNFEKKLKKNEFAQLISGNVDAINQEFEDNPHGAFAYFQKYAADNQIPMPDIVNQMYKSAQLQNKEANKATLQSLIATGQLDESFINSLTDTKLIAEAKAAFNAQQITKFGEGYPALLAGFTKKSQKLAEFESRVAGATDFTSERLETMMKRWAAEDLKITQNADTTEANLRKLIENAHLGEHPSVNPFSYTIVDGVRQFRAFEQDRKETTEQSELIAKKAKGRTLGELVSIPNLLFQDDEAREIVSRSQSGLPFTYPRGVRQVHDMYSQKGMDIPISAVMNEAIIASNKVTGKNIPLLDPEDSRVAMYDGLSPAFRKLFDSGIENGVSQQVRRSLSQYTGNMPRRASMGGGSFNPNSVPDNYGGIIQKAATENNIPPEILAGLVDTETSFLPKFMLNKEQSPAGAAGAGQFMPDTAAEFGVDVNDPVSSIDGAARYLRYLTDYFGGNMELAIYAYNGGMGNIEKYGGPIPNNKENEEYLQKVLNNSTKYR